jgi:bacteriocin biosynthesis cyclodehydratase domain-containing protein
VITESHPRVRRTFSVISHDLDVVELRTGVWNPQSFLLTDQSGSGKLSQIVTGLDGTTSRKDLAQQAGVGRADVDAVLDHLSGLGAIQEGPSSALDAYLDSLGSLGTMRPADPVTSRVLVVGDPGLARMISDQLDGIATGGVALANDHALWQRLRSADPADFQDALSLRELAQEFDEWRGAFVVYADTVINPLQLSLFNRIALAADIAWIHGALDGPFLFIGPTFIAGRAACYECFETRVAMNLQEGASYQRYKQALARGQVKAGELAAISPLLTVLAGHLAMETVNYLYSGSNFTIERTLAIFVPAMEIAFNDVLRVPGCPACGSLPERDDAVLYFDPRAWLDE